MAQVSDCISHMIKGMDARPDVVGAACEALHKMFERNHTELVAQVNGNERVLVTHRHYPFAILKREGNWSKNAPRNCFWDPYLGRAGQLLANFFHVPNNSPRSVCDS